MASFPALSSGVTVKYPVTRSPKYRTGVLCSINMQEQRFPKGGALLEDFELTFNDIKTADKELIRAFFVARQGALDTTWDLTFNDVYRRPQDASAGSGETTTWDHLQFTPNQVFTAVENKPERWKLTLKIRQTRKNG